MGARVHIELAEEFPEDEYGTLPGRLRLTDVPEHHHENCDIECHEDGECAGRVFSCVGLLLLLPFGCADKANQRSDTVTCCHIVALTRGSDVAPVTI